MKNITKAIVKKAMVAVFAIMGVMAACAELTRENLMDDNGNVVGYKVTGLGDDKNETAVVFTAAGVEIPWTVPYDLENVEFLVVGGGGGGGASNSSKSTVNARGGAGGGGGGIVAGSLVNAVRKGSRLLVAVGKGGEGGAAGKTPSGQNAGGAESKGGYSWFSVDGNRYVYVEGGGRDLGQDNSGGNGGSCAGGRTTKRGTTSPNHYTVISNQYVSVDESMPLGNWGGTCYSDAPAAAAGGGGACGEGSPSAVDKNGSTTTHWYAGDGGQGLISFITGEPVMYGSGGGGGVARKSEDDNKVTAGKAYDGAGAGATNGNGRDGLANQGGGGGGGGRAGNGGNGGSGVVVLRYKHRPVLPVVNLIYNGNEQVGIYEVGFEVISGTKSAREVGTYTAILRPKGDGFWFDGTEGDISVTWKIWPKLPENSAVDLANGYIARGLGENGNEIAVVFTNENAEVINWIAPTAVNNAQFLVVGGGGGGGADTDDGTTHGGAGGGGGGVVTGLVNFVSTENVGVVVGRGGEGGSPAALKNSKYGAADNGTSSSFTVSSDKYVRVAGGGGDNGADFSTNDTGTSGNVGNSGGSSAGSRPGQSGRAEVVSPEAEGVVFADMTFGRKGGAGNTTDNKYYNYYSTAGGGGGATEEGGTPTDSKFGGKGGAGVLSVITGEPLVYGSGGGGGTINGLNGGEGGEGAGSGNVAGVTVSTYAYYMDAVANQGGGGGGGSRTIPGGKGGSGIVAFRFEYNEVASVDGYGYLDLDEAISAADAGDTVTLLANAGNIELGKSIALNLNGCTVDQITLTDAAVTLTAPEKLNVVTGVKDYDVVYADGVYSLQKVAVVQIGETTYATLAEAVAAAQSGDTIVLIENVELAETVTIPVGKTLTIDLNGKSISMEESIVTTAYALNNLGTLTLTDSVGTGSVNARGIYNGYGNGGDNVSSAKLIIQSGTYNAKGTNGGAAIFNYGIVEINGGTFTSVGGYSLNNQSGASMTVAGATANNGIYNTGATLTINSGNISGNRSGCHVIYAWNSNVTINGGEFYNNNSGNATIMTAGSSQLTINNGIFGIKDGRVPGNGNTWTSCLTDTANTATMTVNGGTFNGGFRVQAGTTMTINGGSYNDCYGSKYNISGTITVKGGSFTDATAKTFANENLAEGYELAEDGTVVKAAPTTVEVGTLAELQDALADNSNDLPIVVTATIKIPAGDTVELDLNGKTVTSVYQTNSTDKHIYPLNVYGNLTIKDTKGNGSITGRGIYVQVGSKLTIDGGCIYAIDSNGGSALWMYGGDVVINGGHIEQKAEGTYNFAINAPAGTVTVNGGWVGGNHGAIASSGAAVVINGGELVCTGTAGMTDNVLYTYDTGSITINGGTFVADNDVPAGGCCVYDANGGVTINGGTFGNSSGGDVWGTTGGTTIKGGTFSNLIETQHIADGYKLGENGQVVAKPVVAKIGEVGYATLKAAVEAVEDNGTITLLGNVTITEATRTHNSGTWYDGIYYVGDKSFTIDFAGFTVTQDGSVNDYLLNFKNDGSKANTITLKNGTIDAGTAAYCAICTSSASTQKITINTENINIVNNISNGSTVKIRGGAEFNAKAGTKITGKNSYLGIECVASTVNIYDGAEIYMNGTGSYNGCLVGACGGGVVNVYGGYGKGVKGGFIAMTSGGTINISGGEWIANTDGSVGDNSNLYVLTAQNNKNESGWAGASVINVTGGTFRGGMDAWVLNNIEGEKSELNIAGGNFNVNPANYLEAGYLASEAAGIYTVAKAVAKIGDTYYTSLEDAFNAAAEGDTIVMLADATPALTSQRAITKAAVIDLNGKTLTLTEDDLYFGTTTFKNGNIVVDPSVKPSTAVFWMFANQTLTFDNVKVVATGVTGTYLIGLDGNNSDLNLLNGSEIFVNNTTALDLDIICVNASTGNDIVIDNSKINVTNLDGRVLFRGNYTISGTSEINLEGITKAGIRIEAGQTLSIEDTAKVTIAGEPRDGGIHLTDATATYTKADTATVTATINKPYQLSGAGTEASPYLIQNIDDLIFFRDSVNKGETKYSAPGVYVELAADIDMAGVNWVGIGSATAAHGFMGNFDGKEFKIQNLTITNPAVDSDGYAYAGFFGVTEGTDKNNQNIIKNLTIENVTINTTGHIVSAAIAYPYYTIVDNVKVCGNINIKGGDYTAGALAYTRRCVNASNISVVGNEDYDSTITGAEVVGGVISDIQMNGGLTAVYSNFKAENLTITGTKMVGGISGIIATQTLNGATVKNVTINCADRAGQVAGSFGELATISNIVVENVTGADAIIGGGYDGSAPVEAKIGDTFYATFAAAYDAAQAGQTIKLLSDVTLTGKLTISKPITIDGDGHSIIANHTAFILETSSDCEIKNVTLDTNNKAKGVKIASGNVVFDTVTIPNSNKSDAITVNGNLVIKNYFKVESTYQVFDARYGSVQVEEGAVFDFTSRIGLVSPSDDDLTGAVDVNGKPYFCAYGSTAYYKTLSSVLTTITDLTLLDDVALNSNLSLKGTLNLNDKTLTIADGKTLKTGGNLEIVGGTFAGPILLTNASHTLIAPEGIEVTTSVAGSRVVYKDGSYTVVKINYVAQIGETKYETIAEAIAAATTGDTVTLIDDAIVDNAVTIPEGKEITLDLNGNDIVGKMNCIVNNGILVIEDTVGTANVYTTDVSAQGRSAILNNATGTLTIFGGWFGDSNNDMTDRNALNRGNALKNYGMVTVKGGYFTNVSNQYISYDAYAYAINTLVGGKTVIDNATVYGDINGLIYSDGETVVNGGSFTLGRPNEENNLWYLAYGNVEIKGGVWTRAFKVPSWNTGDPKFEGNVVVSGGIYSVDVSDNCAEDCAALKSLDGKYVVGAKPTATVNNLGSMTIPESDYIVYQGNKNGDMPLSFVMQFLADQNAEDMETSPYADWYGDFVITFDGLEDGGFTADGCYLAGYYGDFGWVKVPVDGMKIENGVRYPVMLGVGMGQKYEYICSEVNDFRCAMYLTPEVLANHPNLTVKLELSVVDNSQGEDAARDALADNSLGFVNKVGETEYDAEDFVTGLSGSGTEADPFLIKSLDDLVLFRDSVNAGETKYNAPGVWVALAADIDLATVDNWEPIGNWDYSFDANFDGNGHKIQNLKMSDTVAANGESYLGFFGITANNAIKDLVIENVTISSSGQIVAAAIAYPYYTTVDNITVCGNIAINGGNYTAGVLAYTRLCQKASNLTVAGNEGSYITGAQAVGGIMADIQMNKGLIADYANFSVSGVTITGTKMVGGIAGIIATQTLEGASVKNVTLVCEDSRVGIVVGSFGGTCTISGIVAENVTGATAVIGAAYDGAAAVQARIGDTFYATFAEALNAAKGGESVTLLANVGDVVLGKSIALDLNGCTIGEITLAGAGVTLTASAGLDVVTSSEGCSVVYADGVYSLQPVTLPEVVITDIKNTLTDADPDLTFALNFAIKDVDKLSEEYLEKLFAKYGDYYTDYVLTISGLTDPNGSVKFNANGNGDGYLAGQYDAWSKSWVTVPFSDVTVTNGQSFYIMEYAAELMGKGGLRLTLKEVAEIVKNFDCGVYFTPEFLAANPNLKVELELKVFTEDENGNKVGDISVATNTFDKDDFSVEAAKLDIRIVNGKPQIGFAGEGKLVLNAATALTGEWTKNIEYTAVENDGDDTKTWVTPKDGYYFFKGYIVR